MGSAARSFTPIFCSGLIRDEDDECPLLLFFPQFIRVLVVAECNNVHLLTEGAAHLSAFKSTHTLAMSHLLLVQRAT